MKEKGREEREKVYLDPVGKEKSVVVVLRQTRGISGPEVGVAGSTHFEEDLEYGNMGFLFSKALKFEPHVVWGK